MRGRSTLCNPPLETEGGCADLSAELLERRSLAGSSAPSLSPPNITSSPSPVPPYVHSQLRYLFLELSFAPLPITSAPTAHTTPPPPPPLLLFAPYFARCIVCMEKKKEKKKTREQEVREALFSSAFDVLCCVALGPRGATLAFLVQLSVSCRQPPCVVHSSVFNLLL